jgi:NNP family nitrate/nitrite transporter-like MFS transporter
MVRRESIDVHTKSKGHWPTLLASFLHFDVSFMLWVLLGALGVFVGEAAALDPAQKGLVVAVPILSGSLLRVPLGLAADRFGGRRVGTLMLLALYVPLLIGSMAGPDLTALVAVGLLLGVAGASFAVALPLASRWYPPEKQGLAMGIAAAGNSGTVVTNLVAPRLAALYGWQQVLLLATLPLTLALVVFVVLARDAPGTGRPRQAGTWRRMLATPDLWWFCALYAVTFGGYVGLSSFLPILLRDQYALSPVVAGTLTAVLACAGSLARPAGGHLADRWGGARLLSILIMAVASVYAAGATLPGLSGMAVALGLGMLCLGLGNGAVFQMVPQRFREEIGMATGVIGAVGGIGGFVVPIVLGHARAAFGSFAPGFLFLTLLAASAGAILSLLVISHDGWRASWRTT